MAPLHIAACHMYPAIIELLLLNKKTNIEINSPLHGTPLHVACLVGSVKIVQ
jgi:ankyrin repeat protein